MNVKKWYEARGPRFVRQRAISLLQTYGVAPTKAIRRIDDCVETLAGYGCAPTFPTPGIVVQRCPQFIRHLQDAGAEIAVHSYQHIDLRALPVPTARQQLVRAVQTFERFEIEVHGFRCPYLGWTQELRDALPDGMFDYSSNDAISCQPDNLANHRGEFFEKLRGFYQGKPFSETVCLPSLRSNLIEIPVCVPDDLQLHDGAQLDSEGMGQVWSGMLDQIHQRGELFTLLFHPELASLCESPFVSLLRGARQFRPRVWIARLRDIAEWWREKARFSVDISSTPAGLHLAFNCSERASILVRGLEREGLGPLWDGKYRLLQTRAFEVPTKPRPFVGVSADAPRHVVHFLQEQGYILDTGETASRCGTYLDVATLAGLSTEVELVDHIEAAPGPLVRYWRWPNGAKSALCITGDLDALTLLDYASRLFAR